MQFFDNAFPIYVMTYTLTLSSTYVFSFCDLIWRLLTPYHCSEDDPVIREFGDDEEGFGCGCTDDVNEAYVDITEVEKEQVSKQEAASDGSVAGSRSTASTTGSKSSTSSSAGIETGKFFDEA